MTKILKHQVKKMDGRFPRTRMRRNRQDAWSRAMVSENTLASTDLMWPVFISEGGNTIEPISSMPDVNRLGIDALVDAVAEVAELGHSRYCVVSVHR